MEPLRTCSYCNAPHWSKKAFLCPKCEESWFGPIYRKIHALAVPDAPKVVLKVVPKKKGKK